MQDTIDRCLKPADDAEFEAWDIVIDRSFIHTNREVMARCCQCCYSVRYRRLET